VPSTKKLQEVNMQKRWDAYGVSKGGGNEIPRSKEEGKKKDQDRRGIKDGPKGIKALGEARFGEKMLESAACENKSVEDGFQVSCRREGCLINKKSSNERKE